MFIAYVPPPISAPFGAELKWTGTHQDVFRSEPRWSWGNIPVYKHLTPSGVMSTDY